MPREPVLADVAYKKLREALAHGTLRPNQRLVEAELTELFDIGRTPIRSALLALENQGLIIKQRTSWTVREFGPADIRNVYQVRMALEGFAARLTATVAEDGTLKKIEQILAGHGDKLGTLDADAQVKLNADFHGSIARACGNPHLIAQIERNQQFHFDFHTARLYTAQDYAVGHASHHEIVGALLRRDPDAAEELTRAHYELSLKTLLERL
ncbi:GntR family transcriptional regulator [Nonomuraea sp. NPDC050786]|uniref:GntR family transcriptional regulator n=1 Tax=Nonomuraea sp. NPDC050786 TaxID=3154840 RepID=UPI00340ED4EF